MTANRAQADALEIEAGAKRRLADEYDAAQERGEIRTQRDNQAFSGVEKASGSEVVPPKELHEARIIRDAEVAEPVVTSRCAPALTDRAPRRRATSQPTKLSGTTLRARCTTRHCGSWRPPKTKGEHTEISASLQTRLGASRANLLLIQAAGSAQLLQRSNDDKQLRAVMTLLTNDLVCRNDSAPLGVPATSRVNAWCRTTWPLG
jgi:hypothetical protein